MQKTPQEDLQTPQEDLQEHPPAPALALATKIPAPKIPARKIFVLGDSRTGTLTLHRYFEALGLRSVHWYVAQSGQAKPAHLHAEENWRRCREFIAASGCVAFSDYPTRSHYDRLAAEYPHALFILTVRRDVETWRRSMTRFFAKFDMALDIDKLTQVHVKMNDDIRRLMKDSALNFLEICIDDDVAANSAALQGALGVSSALRLGWENRTDHYDNSLLSRRARFFNPSSPDGAASLDAVSYAEAGCRGSKALPSERGWLFLVNDANDFLRYQFGLKRLAPAEVAAAGAALRRRAEYFEARGVAFLCVVVPEKSVVYREFLPLAFEGLAEARPRPVEEIAKAAGGLHYLADYFQDLKSYGLLYFRGDSHANWLGAYFLYLYIAERMNRALAAKGRGGLKPPLALGELAAEPAQYNGDLYVQARAEHADQFKSVWRFAQGAKSFESLLSYRLASPSTQVVEPPAAYLALARTRPLIVREHKDKTLPRAVIFRDSTADFIVEWLAEHFSRSVFVWHKGLVFQDVVEAERPDLVLHVCAERFAWIFALQPALAHIEDLARGEEVSPATAEEEAVNA